MAQSAANEVNVHANANDGFGFYQHVNFGRYKGTPDANVYRIANLGDFKYLLWMLRADKPKNIEGDRPAFKIHPSVIPHVKAALRIQSEKCKWVESIRQDTKDKNCWIMQYITNDHSLEGPPILYRICDVCGKRKNETLVSQKGKKYMCSKCVKDIFD